MIMLRPIANLLARLRRNCAGLAAVELAFLAPMLVTMTLGTVDYSLWIMSKLTVQMASRAGAEHAVVSGYNATNIAAKITGTTRRAAYMSAITANPAPTQWFGCPSSTTGVTVAASSSTICTSTSQTAGTYVTTNAQSTYTPIFPWPLIPNSLVLTSSTTVRIS
jgi:Flp pilus assembly protein TadG